MSRGLSRVAMACLGFVVFAVYSALALGSAVLVWWVLSDPPGVGALALASVLVVLVGGFVGYRLGTLRLLTSLETAPLSRTHAPGVYRLVARLCRRLNVREPRLLVADLGAPNALSLGGPRRGVVVLDRQLLSLLTADELEGILAHELAHIARYDTFLKTLFVTAGRLLVGLVSLLFAPVLVFLHGVDRATAWFAGRPRQRRFGLASRFRLGAQTALGLLFSPLTLLLLAHSRRREYAADERAVEVTGKPTALARALAKIHRASAPRSGLLSLLYVDRRRRMPPPWLSTHPPVDRRIERLLARFGGESEGRRTDRPRP